MRRKLGALLGLSLILPLPAQAQPTPEIDLGARIRVTATDCSLDLAETRFFGFAQDTLWMSDRGQNTGCATSRVEKLEVFKPTSIWKTSGLGFLAGSAGGALLLAATQPRCGGDFGCDRRKFAAFVGGILGGGVGLAVGVITGVTKVFGSWKEVPLPQVDPFVFLTAGARPSIGLSIPLRR